MNILTKKLNYATYKFYYTHQKGDIVILNYCKHGNLNITGKIFRYSTKRNWCEHCAKEIVDNYTEDDSVDFFKEYKEVIEILSNSSKKISKELLYLWYPLLYAKIQSIEGDSWNQKLHMFLHHMTETPKCTCGNKLKFGKNNKFKNKCEHCNRTQAVTEISQNKSEEMWKGIFTNHFNIVNPQFTIYDLHNIQITINDEVFIFKKAHIKKLIKNDIHFLTHKQIDLSSDNVINYTSEFIENFDKYKMLSENNLMHLHPHIYKLILYTKEKFNDVKTLEEIKFLIKNNHVRPVCTMCNNYASFNVSNYHYNLNCETHKFSTFTSIAEKEMANFISSIYTGKILKNHRLSKIGNVDVFLPDLNIAIEYNGLYWHSEKFRPKNYHYDKWLNCSLQNIHLLNVWEDDWKNKQEIVKSIIKKQLKINDAVSNFADTIKLVNDEEKIKFLEENHIEGNCSSSINLGLFNDKLVSLMAFRKINDNEYELTCLCDKLNTNSVDSNNKLFKYFIKEYNPVKVIFYANCDLLNDDLDLLDFRRVGHIGLKYWWAKDSIRYMSETSEMTAENGFIKIWGTGQLKFEFINSV